MFRFVANLKPYTFDPARPRAKHASYLLSIDYYAEHAALAEAVARDGRILVADNGNFDRLGPIAREFTAEAEAIASERKNEETRLGHAARPGELSRGLTRKIRALAAQVAKRCDGATSEDHVASVVVAQVRMRPAYIIGMENFAIPTLLALGIEPAHSGLPHDWYAARAELALDFAWRTREGRYGPCRPLVFAGLHALDFDTARRVGRAAGDRRAEGVAIGLGAALSDTSYVDHRIEDGRIVGLAGATPRPYVRVAEIAAGISQGYAERTGVRPRLHALGVGTPILLPLLAALGHPRGFVATDSTAPIQDGAVSRTIALYTDRPAPLKLKAHVIAERWLKGEPAWHCSCPACRSFLAQHPYQADKAREWWKREGNRGLVPADMWAPSRLADHLPLLGMPKDATIRRAASLARVRHNHFILRRIEGAIAREGSTPARLREWVARVVADYVEANAHPAWKRATEEAWRIVFRASRALDGAGAGGGVRPVPM